MLNGACVGEFDGLTEDSQEKMKASQQGRWTDRGCLRPTSAHTGLVDDAHRTIDGGACVDEVDGLTKGTFNAQALA